MTRVNEIIKVLEEGLLEASAENNTKDIAAYELMIEKMKGTQ